MDRELHPTPRHLDEPLRIAGLTVSQLVALVLGATLCLLCLTYLPGSITMSQRLVVGVVLGGLPVLLVSAAVYSGIGLLHLAGRIGQYTREAREYLPGPPTEGPSELRLSETAAYDTSDDL